MLKHVLISDGELPRKPLLLQSPCYMALLSSEDPDNKQGLKEGGGWVERGEMHIEVRGRLRKPASWVWVDAPPIELDSKREGFWNL